MRLFLDAPIEYSAEKGGYRYTDANFQFPGAWVSEEEIVSWSSPAAWPPPSPTAS